MTVMMRVIKYCSRILYHNHQLEEVSYELSAGVWLGLRALDWRTKAFQVYYEVTQEEVDKWLQSCGLGVDRGMFNNS
jgi:hypothetical protein